MLTCRRKLGHPNTHHGTKHTLHLPIEHAIWNYKFVRSWTFHVIGGLDWIDSSLPLDWVIQLHLFKLPGSAHSTSLLSSSSAEASLPSEDPNLSSPSVPLPMTPAKSSEFSQELKSLWTDTGILGSQLDMELLREDAFEFCDRERDERLRIEQLFWMPSGYTLCRCLDSELFPCELRIGLLSNTCLPILPALDKNLAIESAEHGMFHCNSAVKGVCINGLGSGAMSCSGSVGHGLRGRSVKASLALHESAKEPLICWYAFPATINLHESCNSVLSCDELSMLKQQETMRWDHSSHHRQNGHWFACRSEFCKLKLYFRTQCVTCCLDWQGFTISLPLPHNVVSFSHRLIRGQNKKNLLRCSHCKECKNRKSTFVNNIIYSLHTHFVEHLGTQYKLQWNIMLTL